MRRALVAAVLACSTVAYAGPHQTLVLRAEGTADTASRTNVDAQVLRLAKHLDGKVDAGDITLTDAAAAAGCNPSDTACKDEILATLAVDEIVTTTVTASGGQLNVTVRRLSPGVAPKVAQASLPPGGAPDAKVTAKLDAELGPLFGLTVVTPVKPAEPAPTETSQPPPPVDTPQPPMPVETQPPMPVETQPMPPPAPLPVDEGAPARTWQKVGMGVGVGFGVLGILLWSAAAAKQGDIDDAPTNTPADFTHLTQLEKDADGLAGGGNFFFVTGAIIAGVSTYFYVRAGRRAHAARTATLVPTVTPHGAGLVLTFGGSR